MSEVQCPKGHSWPAEFRFCPTCGDPTAAAIVDGGVAAGAERMVEDRPTRHDPVRDAEVRATGSAATPTGRSARRSEALQSRGALTVASVLVVACAVVVAIVASEGWVWSHTHQTSSVYGTLTLDDVTAAQHHCTGTGANSDISASTVVALRNQDGTILGATTLGEGKQTSAPGNCVFIFTLADVPVGESTYSLEISDHAQITKTKAELASANWTFTVAYGDHGAEGVATSPTAPAGS